jgi:Leucine-rich repeat (LRR) protein
VEMAIDDSPTKTHDWTAITKRKETRRKAEAKEKGAQKVNDKNLSQQMEKCMAILLKNQPHPDTYPPKIKDASKVDGLTAWDINDEELALIAPYLSHLKMLHFYRMSVGGPSVSDISPLKVMKNLEKLIFDGTCEKVTDFSVLRNLKNLKQLNLEGTQFSDVSSLGSLTKLEILNLCDTPVKDLSALKNLKKLTKLNLDGTQVSDVSVLENLKNLKTLDLEGTQVKDLSALKNLKDITELRLVETPVRNLSPLHGLKLKSLDVELNKFSVKELEMDAKFLSKIKDLYAGSGDYDVKLLRFFVKHRIGNEFRVAYKKIPVEVILDKQVRTIESRKELEGLGLDETVLSGVDLKSNLILTEQKDLNDPNGTRLIGIEYSVTNRSFSVGVMTTCIGFRDAGRWTTKFYSVKRVD